MQMRLEKLLLGVALVAACLISLPAFSAGTIPLSMSQQFDSLGKPLGGGKLFLIKAGTIADPQNCFQDASLTLPWPNPLTLDSAGRVPQLYCADGSIKIRLTSKTGVAQLVADNVLVVGPSSGGGGGGSVDQTSLLQTGQIIDMYATDIVSGFVRCNGRSIGAPTSGATERANIDTQALYNFLWQRDPNLAVSGGRGASSAADYSANKVLSLPDCRGRVRAGLDDMGTSPAGVLTSSFFASPTTLGAIGGSQSRALATANLPPYTPSGTVNTGTLTVKGNISNAASGPGPVIDTLQNAGGSQTYSLTVFSGFSFTGSPQGGTSNAFGILPPTLLISSYIRL